MRGPFLTTAFDRWNDDRDRYIENSQSYRHVSPAISGAEDLDQNGRWVNDPNYGSVWQPTVGADWAPYQNGRWVWEDYYGWTWVSYDSWGWAPYHYGRWFWGVGGWAWYPGPVFAQPYWAPAYVGFFGFGGGLGVGVGFGFGGVGWVALAPFEAFHPWWGRGFYGGFGAGGFANHTTIVSNANVYNSFRNARVTGGAIGVSTSAFGRGGQYAALNRTQLQSAGLVHGVLPVAPDRSSLRLSDRSVSGRYPQARSQSFASRMQAPRVSHTSFEQQQRGMEQMSHANFTPAGGRELPHWWLAHRNRPRTDGITLASRFTAPLGPEAAAHIATVRRRLIVKAARCGSARPSFSKGVTSKGVLSKGVLSKEVSSKGASNNAAIPAAIIPSRGVLQERARRPATVAADPAAMSRRAETVDALVAAEAITARKIFQFLPSARTSASQRVRAFFF